MKRYHHWDLFFRISTAATAHVPSLDPEWLAARGINFGAPYLIDDLRHFILPFIRRLERRRVLSWYFFLIHDRTSGVPTSEDDHAPYIHLRLVFKKPYERITLMVPDGFHCRPVDEPLSGGHVKTDSITDGKIGALRLLATQSEWVLRLLELHADEKDQVALLKNVHQFLHYFSNMLQMRVS